MSFLLTKLGNGRVKLLSYMLFIYIIFQAIIRGILFFYSSNAVSWNVFSLVKTFILGMVYDLSVGVQALLPLILIFLLLPAKWFERKWYKVLFSIATFIFYFFMIFNGVSEYLFWDEFQTRFNFIAVDYLIYTNEVLGNIKESYNIWAIVAILTTSGALLTYIQNRFIKAVFLPINLKSKVIGTFCLLLLPFLLFKTIDSNWRNYVSSNKYNVEIAANGLYEFVSAFRNNQLDYDKFYVTENDEKVISHLRELMKTQDSKFLDEKTLTRHISSDNKLKTPNIVMIVVESLSADFMQSFGNSQNITPNLDALAKESLFFTKVYATGTRTVRGLESLSLCIPPTPGQSVVRRPENQDMFLFGSVLKKHGYANNFIYGGYGYFDNMNAFYQDNGYNVIDRTDIPKSEVFFETIWGVADEIVFDQAIKQLDANTKQKQKTFQMIVTTSNHRPFTYPDKRIDLPTGKREGAVKYTDWAIGDFIAKAKKKDWFNDTIFIIIADHQASSAGKVSLPVSKYHIPFMIYAPGIIDPAKNYRLMSQIDVAPTILGLLGFSYDSRFMGYDINKLEKGRERVFISTYQNLGYIKEDKLVILKPKKGVEMFKINNFETNDYTPIAKDEKLIKEAIAWYQGTSYLYKNNLLKNI